MRSAIILAHNLGLSVVADGVENDEAQGFHMSRPLPAPEFATFAKRRHQRDDFGVTLH